MTISNNRNSWTFDALLQPILKLCELLTILIGSFLIGSLVVNVILRYAFNYSFGWIDELASVALPSLMFIICVVGFHEKSHIGVSYLLDRIPEKYRQLLEFLINVGIIILFAIVGYYGVFVAKTEMAVVLSTVPLPRGIFFCVIPLTSGAIVIVSINHILAILNDFRCQSTEKGHT